MKRPPVQVVRMAIVDRVFSISILASGASHVARSRLPRLPGVVPAYFGWNRGLSGSSRRAR